MTYVDVTCPRNVQVCCIRASYYSRADACAGVVHVTKRYGIFKRRHADVKYAARYIRMYRSTIYPTSRPNHVTFRKDSAR